MAKPVKKNKEILNKLNSDTDNKVIEAINELRYKGNILYLDDLFGIYNSKLSSDIKKAMANFISDIRENEAASYIVEFINRIKNENDLALFTSSCWQSRINFEAYVDEFTNLIIKGNYQTSIEAFTVVENCLNDLTKDEINRQIKKLKDSLPIIASEKKLFVVEVINTLKSYDI